MEHLVRKILLGFFLIVLLAGWTHVHAEEFKTSATEEDQKSYELDLELSGGNHAPYTPKQKPPLVVEKKEDKAQIKVETNGQLKPYLGAGKEAQPSKDVIPLLSKEDIEYYNKSYNIETGVGINVKENVDLNLGYRVKSQLSLMDGPEEEQDRGQIRFGVHFNY